MKQTLINDVVKGMLPHLTNGQIEKLRRVLTIALQGKAVVITEKTGTIDTATENNHLTELFIAAKRVEGCSEKSLKYYTTTIKTMLVQIGKPIKHITTDDLRSSLTDYQSKCNSSKVTLDNMRRILSSFFSWLEDEDYIIKSPVRRIHKVKTASNIKETYRDEELEIMRDSCVMYTTNAVESIHSSFRKVTKQGAFPNENALLKLFYLRIMELYAKWNGSSALQK